MRPALATALAALLLALLPAARADEAPLGRARLVLLPVEDVAGQPSVASGLAPAVATLLARRGYDVLHGATVERWLEEGRIRYLDSLPAPALAEALSRFGAGGVVFMALVSYANGADARVALAARLVDRDGRQVWAASVGLSMEDTVGLLGRGRAPDVEALLVRAGDRLFASVPTPGQPGRGARRRRPPDRLDTWRAAELDPSRPQRVAVLPFENFSERRDAPRVLSGAAARRLPERGGLEAVEAGDLREAMIAERVRSFRGVDSGQLARIGERLGTTLFLRGTIYEFREGQGGRPPRVDLHLTLVDVAGNRVLWTSRVARSGSDYEGLLQRGAITTVGALADQAVAELVGALRRS